MNTSAQLPEPEIEQPGIDGSILERRLRLLQIIGEVSNEFINLPVDQIDGRIADGLGKLARFLGFNGAAITKLAAYGRGADVGYLWTAPDVPPVLRTFTERDFPWSAECHWQGLDVMLPTMDALPPAASVDRATFEHYDARSSYSKILRSGTVGVGVMALVSLGRTRAFPEDLQGEIELFAQVLANALARQRAAIVINEAFAFERTVTEISRRLLESDPGSTAVEVERGLHALADVFRVDRCTFWELNSKQKRFTKVHSYHAQADLIPGTVETHSLPWFINELSAGRSICLERVSDLPANAVEERSYWTARGLKSALLVPLMARGQLAGCFSLAAVKAERQWPPDLVRRFQLAGELLTNALLRKHADEALRKSEERLSLAADSAGAGLWSLDLKSSKFWITDKTREIFQLPSDEPVTFDTLLKLVHPEDRGVIEKALREMLESKDQRYLEYRVNHGDANAQWLATRGRVHCKSSGEPDYVMGVTVDITTQKRAEQALLQSYAEIKELKDRLQAETDYLKEEIKITHSYGEIVGSSPAIRNVLHQVEQVASTDSSVLIRGETGTGKELVANAIHRASSRKDRMMVMVNCAALPTGLIESELFGRERGAYTGALTRQAGRFEVADKSTLLLDEIGELSLEIQAKLLRVLETGEFERLGSANSLKVNVRLIAATNRDLAEAVTEGKFREDLYYRLNVFPIFVPPLRERPEDIPELVWAFVQQLSKRMGRHITKIPRKAMESLQRYHWPGNVRQLRNIIEHSVIISSGDTLRLAMPEDLAVGLSRIAPLADRERQHILQALEMTRGRIKGPKGAAAKLGLKPSTLYTRMKKLQIPTRRERLSR